MKSRGLLLVVVAAVALTVALGVGTVVAAHRAADPSGASSAYARERALLDQLEAGDVVPRDTFAWDGADGAYLCRMKVYGEKTPEVLYAKVLCGFYSRDDDAVLTSGSSLPAVLTVRGEGGDTRLVSAKFPRQESLQMDQQRLFPAPVLRAIFADDDDPAALWPSEHAVVAEARASS